MADGSGAIPEPKEEYQKKLKAFIAAIPMDGSDLVSGTPSLPMPKSQEQIDALKGLKTNPAFKTFTGWEHKALLEVWLKNGTTTCNEFCSKCGVAMGYAQGVGKFDIADRLNAVGLGHCWIPAASKSTPDYGDIFWLYARTPDRNGMDTNHMGVSLHVDGTKWYTVESGQGGRSKGHEIIKRKEREWMPSSMQGWVSMKALLNADTPLPYWMGGWWEVKDGNQTYYYHFSAGNKVAYTPHRPNNLYSPPAFASMSGHVVAKGIKVDIHWAGPDPDESFTAYVSMEKKKPHIMMDKPKNGRFKLTHLM